jgi:hypothetical protein
VNILQLTPGAGAMYCGGCLRDNALVAALRQLGHQALMVPLYLPLTLDEEDQSVGTPIFFAPPAPMGRRQGRQNPRRGFGRADFVHAAR